MRKLIPVLGVLLAPAMAAAQSVSIDLVGGAHPGPFVSSIDGSSFAPGDQFVLWSVINTDTAIDGVEYRIHVNGDADNDKFSLVDYAAGPLSAFDPGGSLDGLGDAFVLFGSAGFAPSDYVTRKDEHGAGVLPNDLNALSTTELVFATAGLKAASDINGDTLVGYVVEANADFTLGFYEFSVLGPIGGGFNTAIWTASGQVPSNGTITEGASFILTPEPTSALLLLAAVPFLRRRRA